MTRRRSAAAPPAGPAPELSDAELSRALETLERALFKYPLAVQAAFGALVAEGRRFAATPEGAIWRERLQRSQGAGRARLVWEVLSLSSFTERSDGPLPSALLDKLVRAVKHRHLEPLLSRVFEGRL